MAHRRRWRWGAFTLAFFSLVVLTAPLSTTALAQQQPPTPIRGILKIPRPSLARQAPRDDQRDSSSERRSTWSG